MDDEWVCMYNNGDSALAQNLLAAAVATAEAAARAVELAVAVAVTAAAAAACRPSCIEQGQCWHGKLLNLGMYSSVVHHGCRTESELVT